MKKLKYKPIKLGRLLLLCVAILFSCQKGNNKKIFGNVLILGNSITQADPNPAIGWNGNWGMAASSEDKDYVHLLIRRFQEQNSNVKVNFENIANFEADYWQYDLSNLNSLRVLKPDLIIIRIGENVDRNTVVQHQFKQYYSSLVQYLKKDNLDTKVLCVASFWKMESVENAIKSSSLETNSTYVELSSLDDIQYMAWNEFSDSGVHIHPSDKGMSAIADIIWTEVIKL